MAEFEMCRDADCPTYLRWEHYKEKFPYLVPRPHCHPIKESLDMRLQNLLMIDVIARWRNGRFERYGA